MDHLEKRIALGNLPTPIQKMNNISRFLEGPDIYIKRDDLTGVAFSGNKVRKLEFCGAFALEKGYDVLISCGGIQSNHARATAAAASKLGLGCHLVLGGKKPVDTEGNLFLDQILGASITFADGYGLNEMEDLMEEIAEDYRTKDFKPYIIPLGASDARGSLGYIKASMEMKEQFDNQGFEPDHIICPTGSGGTLSGLLAGKDLCGISSRITGFSVAFDSMSVKSKVMSVLEEIKGSYFPELNIEEININVNDSYIGEGYTKTTMEQLKMIKEVASREALLFDPTYTGKAFYGVTEEIRNGKYRKGEKILFIHTGGVFGLFPYKERFREDIF